MHFTLGDKVRKLRRERGLSQRQLAGRAGVSRNYISLIERGEADNVTLNALGRLAEALETSLVELLGVSAPCCPMMEENERLPAEIERLRQQEHRTNRRWNTTSIPQAITDLIDAAYETGYYSGRGEDGQEHHVEAIARREQLRREVSDMVSLTPGEQAVIQALVEAWNLFAALPEEHADDVTEFRYAIHDAERIVLIRPVRRQPGRKTAESDNRNGSTTVTEVEPQNTKKG
jgi:transcriptional regulator with XRE-family HTH domain